MKALFFMHEALFVLSRYINRESDKVFVLQKSPKVYEVIHT